MIQKLIDNIVKKDAPIVVGLDPTLKFVPKHILDECFEKYGADLKGAAEAIWLFNKAIVDATYDLIPAVKPQIAMYEQFGVPEWKFSKEPLITVRKKDLSLSVM